MRVTGPIAHKNITAHKGDALTPREVQVMDLLVLGMTNREIASSLGIVLGTVEVHVSNIMWKVKLGRRVLLALYWHDHSKPG